jgi:hypothetical protein
MKSKRKSDRDRDNFTEEYGGDDFDSLSVEQQ